MAGLSFLSVLLLCATSIVTVRCQSFDPNKAGPQSWDPSQVGTDKTTNQTYRNPIFTQNVGDPWMTRYTHDGEDWYLFTYTTNDNITLRRSKSLTDNWDTVETRTVFKPDPDSGEPWATDLWAPEIHQLNGSWYIIFTATPDRDNPPPMQDAMCPINCPAINHRMFVLAGDGPDPWTTNFTMKGMLNTFDQFAIDGTYFQYGGELYHIYSCWEQQYSAWPANLCITHMTNPWTVDSNLTDRRIISVPNEPWERTNQTFIIYSAARVNTPFYCLAQLELVGNDPMEYQSWLKNRDGCVFHQNTQAGVFATGHASFTTSPDGSEDYVVYHAMTTADPPADIYRTIRTQKIDWDQNTGSPKFPLAENGPFPVPAGQNGAKLSAARDLPGSVTNGWAQ
ncbi:alpha-N-arabinofuranosidase 2 [Coniochaeta sp. 2T2.1]|nr:alpha-N-arabinofuranosidase 2 [Coniochaeta sp. 2T2.1]